jgi:ATP-dependent Clp protease ATP-binding subunit ClpX
MLELDTQTLKKILIEPKNALTKQYIRLFEMDDIKLTFTDDSLDYIVEKAVEFKLGARGLRSICETILIEDMFNLPGSKTKKLIVDKSYIASKLDNFNLSKLKEAS